ncbi:MAG: T9SS type A sorting domain-containing protein [Desulfomonilaceae bacterium]
MSQVTAPADPSIAKIESFTGSSELYDNQLSWVTDTEKNCSYISLQRSCDYVEWEEAVKLKADGNSTQQLIYSYKDESPYNGFTYYRLKEVADDGSFTYSPSIVVESKMQIAVEIYPNPADGVVKITVMGKENESSNVYIKDMMGRVLFYADVVNNSSVELDIAEYPEGIYAVDVESRSGSTVQRLIKR